MRVEGLRATVRAAVAIAGSLRTGLVIWTLLIVYLAVSALPPAAEALRSALGATDGLYRHGLFYALLAAGGLNLYLATVRRIGLRVETAGAWIAHLGVFVLAGGAAVYAARAEHGMCAAFRGERGFSAMGEYYLPGSLALTVESGGAADVKALAAAGEEPDAAVLRRPDGDIHADVRRVLRDATMVELRLTLGDRSRLLALCPAVPEVAFYDGGEFFLTFQSDVDITSLKDRLLEGAEQMSCDVAAVLDVSGAGPLLLLARPDGTRELMELPPGEDVEIRLADRPVSIRVEGLMRRSGAPADPASPPRAAVVDVEFEPDDPSSLDSAAGTRRTVLVPYASARAPDAAVQVSGPEGRFAALYLTPRYRPLPAVVEVLDVEYLPQPGSLIPRDFVTEVRVDSGDRTRRGRIRLNRPLRVGPYRLRHERWMGDPRAPQALIFGVSTRPGAAAAWAGMAMVILGSAWGFYLKPLLRGRRAGR